MSEAAWNTSSNSSIMYISYCRQARNRGVKVSMVPAPTRKPVRMLATAWTPATTGMPAIAGIPSIAVATEAKTPVKAGISSKTEKAATFMTPATSEQQQDVSNKTGAS